MKAIVCITFLIYASKLTGQREHPPFPRFALQAGADFSNMNFNKGVPAPASPVAASWKAGFTLGLLMRVPLAASWWLQPEYSFTRRNGADKSTNISYQLDYLSLPVLLSYRISPALSVMAGPEAGILIHAGSGNNGSNTNITHDTEERSLGFTGGLQLDIKKRFFLSARYLQGLNHIGIGQRSNLKEFKYQSASLTAGVRF